MAHINIRILSPHEWATYKDLRLRALADSPEAFGRSLAEEQDRSDAEWSSRLALSVETSWDLPLVAEIDSEPIGLAWGRIDRSLPDVANLYQMWVAPSHRRRGAGQMLLDAVIAWARAKHASYLDLGVAWSDSPAVHLYTRAGFEPVGQPVPFRPGSKLSGQTMRLSLSRNAA